MLKGGLYAGIYGRYNLTLPSQNIITLSASNLRDT